MSDEDLEARLDARMVRSLKEMASEPYKRLMTQLLGKMGLKVTGSVMMDDVAFLEGEREGAKYLVMASRRPEHASVEGVRIARERAQAEKRAAVLIVAHDIDAEAADLAAKEEVSLADRGKLVLLIKRYELSFQLTKDADRVILKKEGSRALPSAVPFETLLQKADEALRQSLYKEALESLDAALGMKSEHDLAWRMKASAHFYLGEYDDALEAVGQALRIRPGDPTSWYMAGVVLHQTGRLEEEVGAYDQALRFARKMHPALLNKGATLFSMGMREEALKSFEEMLRYYPNDPQAMVNRGLVLKSLGRQSDALKAFDSVAALDPGNVEALVNKATILTDMGDLLESVSAWKEAVAADRRRADLWMRLAQAQKAAGMVDEAKASFEVAENLDIGLEEAKEGKEGAQAAMEALEPDLGAKLPREEGLALKYLDAALLLQAIGRHEEALREADRALSFEPRSTAAALWKASILMEMGRVEEAIPVLSSGLRETPADERFALELESITYRLGRKEEGSRILKPFINGPEARKRVAVIKMMLGEEETSLDLLDLPEGRDLAHDRIKSLALMRKGEHVQAADLLQKLGAAYGPSPQMLNDLAVALRFNGQLEDAEESLHQAIKAEPKYADAWNNLGCVHYLQGAYEEAERCLQEAVQLDRRPEFLLHLGMCQLGQNDLEAAESSFTSAMQLDASPEAFNSLGIVAERRKEHARSLELYEEALKRAPEFRDAQYNRARAKAALKGD